MEKGIPYISDRNCFPHVAQVWGSLFFVAEVPVIFESFFFAEEMLFFDAAEIRGLFR